MSVIEQRKRENCFGVLRWPFAFQIRFIQAVPKQPAVERGEVFIETFHFKEPFSFRDESLGANNQDGGQIHPGAKLFDNEASLDGFSNPNFISDKQTRPVRANQFEDGSILVRHKLHPTSAQ